MNDCTDYCVKDASNGPGDYVARFVRAKPARTLSAAQSAAVRKYAGLQLKYVSKVLVYDDAFRYAPKAELSALFSAIKGRHLRVLRNETGYILTV
jgi:hypothetical protein